MELLKYKFVCDWLNGRGGHRREKNYNDNSEGSVNFFWVNPRSPIIYTEEEEGKQDIKKSVIR